MEEGKGGGVMRRERRERGGFIPKSANKNPSLIPRPCSILPCSLGMRLQKHKFVDTSQIDSRLYFASENSPLSLKPDLKG